MRGLSVMYQRHPTKDTACSPGEGAPWACVPCRAHRLVLGNATPLACGTRGPLPFAGGDNPFCALTRGNETQYSRAVLTGDHAVKGGAALWCVSNGTSRWATESSKASAM